eukprot:gb/GFBE01071624.1/.p1 GENE.gb/GFBE01071624.1/~~gb/GFBE01071624.1/.p1  ORF type:complete len:178 (+),score=36.24 gb/GFBE01071624.1/:1-534(+)
MGQAGSGAAGDKTPTSLVPTSTQLRRAELQSKWWALQANGTASTPLCLQTYGAQYAALSERCCGQHRKEHQRCLRNGKLDPLDMSKWYPVCGESFELENSCAIAVLKQVDKRCSSQLENAASALSGAADQGDPKLKQPLDALGRCMAQLAGEKGLKVEYDAVQAKSRYEASKRLLSR